MRNQEVRKKVEALLRAGLSKPEVFSQLAAEGVKEAVLANFIAAYADPQLCSLHAGKVNVLISIMAIEAFLGFLAGVGMGTQFGSNAAWLLGGLIGLCSLLFAWGFYTHRVGAYNVYIFINIILLPRSLESFASNQTSSLVMLAINLAVLTYVWYVREKVFPDFSFVAPKKVKGEYTFSV